MTDFPQSEAANVPAEASRPDKDRVLIFDTTLRDGEQSPGATMTHEEKLGVAQILDEMGVDIIEAGFPAASNGDFEAVTEISKLVKNAVVCGLARANPKDIDRAGEAVRHAKRGRIHTFIGTSPLHRQFQLQMSTEQVSKMWSPRSRVPAPRRTMWNGRPWTRPGPRRISSAAV